MSIGPNTIFLVDRNIDHSESVLYQLVKSQNDAFSRPSVVCKHINEMLPDEPIRVVINTNGGALCHLEKILKKLLKHKSGYIAYIKNECYSAGALLALGAKEIVMNEDSYIGKIDPQRDGQLAIYKDLEPEFVDARNIHRVREAEYIFNYTNKLLGLIELGEETCDLVKEHLLHSKLPHEALFNFQECKDLIKLNVRNPTDDEKCYFENHNIESYKFKEKKTNYGFYGGIAVTGFIAFCYFMFRM